MKLETPLLNQIIESLQPIKIDLEWSHTEGQFESKGHEVLIGIFSVFANISVYETVTIDDNSRYAAPTCESNGIEYFVEDPIIFSKEENKEFKLTSDQERIILDKIESLIVVNN